MRPHKNGCSCDDCKQYASQRTKVYYLRQQARKRGEKFDIDLVDPEPARQVLIKAKERGLTYNEIERLTGLAKEVTNPLILGRKKRIQRKTERVIFNALEEPDIRAIGPETMLPITVERQMVKCLMAQGWPSDHLVEICRNNNRGTGNIVNTLLTGRTHKAQARNLNQVYWLAHVIGDKQGPSNRAKLAMQRRGHFPLKHYSEKGKLNVRTLTPQQREWLQSTHGEASSSSDSPRPPA